MEKIQNQPEMVVICARLSRDGNALALSAILFVETRLWPEQKHGKYSVDDQNRFTVFAIFSEFLFFFLMSLLTLYSDDGNTQSGDGCFACKLEIGWRCETRSCTST